jgi:hypothetical protein
MLDAIVPLVPLGETELGQILQLELQKSIRNVQFQERAPLLARIPITPTQPVIDAWLQHLEFHTWLQKTTERAILTFSPTGANPVLSSGTLVSSISAHLRDQCLSKLAEMASLVGNEAYHEELFLKIVLETSPSNEDESRELDEFAVQRCSISDDSDDEGPAQHSTAGPICREVCRFSL